MTFKMLHQWCLNGDTKHYKILTIIFRKDITLQVHTDIRRFNVKCSKNDT